MIGEDLPALAVALTGAPDDAAQLLGEVRVLGVVRPDSDASDDGLGLLITRYLRAQPPKRSGPVDVPDPSNDGLRAVLGRIHQLDPLPRAALVLRYLGDLTLRGDRRAARPPGAHRRANVVGCRASCRRRPAHRACRLCPAPDSRSGGH